MRTPQVNKVIGDTPFMLPNNWKLVLRHFHPANSSRRDRKNSQYLTVLELLDEDGQVVHVTDARCSKYDTPVRKRGMEIATHRMSKWMRKNHTLLFPELEGIIHKLFG